MFNPLKNFNISHPKGDYERFLIDKVIGFEPMLHNS